MDVTTQIERTINSLGGSGSSRQDYLSSNKTLNLTQSANSIATAQPFRITTAPYFLSLKDTVGLFGSENSFVKVDLNIQDANPAIQNSETPINGYLDIWVTSETGITNTYESAVNDFRQDMTPVNGFAPAIYTNEVGDSSTRVLVSVDVRNLKTGNQYIDSWFDVSVYDRNGNRLEDFFYSDFKNYFYLGFHARNTRRIPFNVEVEIGGEVTTYLQLPAAKRHLVLAT